MSSAKSSAVVVPTEEGKPQADAAVAATKMSGGALVLSPLPLGGGKRRKTRRLSKKALKAIKKIGASKLAKLLKGGQEAEDVMATESAPAEETVGARRRKSRKGARRSRKSLY